MGVFTVPVEIGDSDGESYARMDALVDTGATFTMVPAPVLRALGLEAIESGAFELADGSRQQFSIGEARIRVAGREVWTMVVFGQEGMTPLLGAYTPERMRLAVDPAGKRLFEVPWRLM